MEDMTENNETHTIGGMLKDARIKKNMTIDEAAEELCIRKYYLNAIENMDFENMPPMPYGLGFVRSYAELLGLNTDRVVFSYRQVMTGQEEQKPLHENNKSETATPHIKHFIMGAVGLALLAVAWSVLPTTSKFEDISEENAVVVPEPVIVADEEEAVIKEVKSKKDKIKKDKDSKAKAEAEVEEKNTTEKEKNVKEVKEEKEETAKEDVKTDKAVLPKMRVVLTGPSWLELRQGNKVLLNNVYNKGYTYELPSGKGLVISVGRPRNVQFFLDDKPIQVASNIKRKNISLDSYFKTQD